MVVACALPAVPAAPASAAGCADVFPPSFVRSLQQAHPDQRVTAAVYDVRTRCWYHLNRGMQMTTASVVKAGVLGAALLRAQDAGRGLTRQESAWAGPMIRLSHNPETSRLYAAIGGVREMDEFDRRHGARSTTNTSAFGATTTTAVDRTLVSLRVLRGGGPLRPAWRAVAWRLMSTVHATQRWGISAGVPRGFEVALKNGFYPMRGNGWRVGSTGFVRRVGTDGGWAITVMTDRGTSQQQGMRLVEAVARRVSQSLGGGAAEHPRSVDRAVCTSTRAGESWGAVAVRVGLPASRGGEVRHVSGGNPSPLQGQRACSPYLRS